MYLSKQQNFSFNTERKLRPTFSRVPVQNELSKSTLDAISFALKNITDKSVFRLENKRLIATIDHLKLLTSSTGMQIWEFVKSNCKIYPIDVYIHYMDDENRRLWVDNCADGENGECSSCPSLVKVEHISEVVARRKEVLVVDGLQTPNEMFPDGIQLTNKDVTNILCVPIMSPSKDRCFIVIELNRKDNKPYEESETRLVHCATKWMGIGLAQTEMEKFNEGNSSMNMRLRNYVKNYFLCKIDYTEFLSKIMQVTKNIVGADRLLFFHIYPRTNNQTSRVDLYEDVMTTSGFKMLKYPRKFKFHRERGLASLVVKTGETVYYTFKEENYFRLDAELVNLLGEKLNSSLCVPVKYHESIIAVIQFINKKGGDCFTVDDEVVASRICLYLSLVQHYEKIKEFCKFEHSKYEIVKAQLGYQLTTLLTVPIYAKLTENDLPDGFHGLGWYPEKNEELVIPWTFYIFKTLFGDIIYDEDSLYEFIINVSKCHRPLPFHNFVHSFDTLHTLFCIIRKNGESFTKAEIFGLALAACCQGVNSEGYKEQYYVLTKHPVTEVFDYPHFRNFQVFFSKRLINLHKLLDYLSEDEQSKIQKIFTDSIVVGILTDVAIRKVTKLLDEDIIDLTNAQHRSYILLMIIRAASKSRITKPFRIGKRLCEDVFRELFAQGDKYRLLKIAVPPWMDRANVGIIPEMEEEYIEKSCMPVFELLARLYPNTEEMCHLCRELQKAWDVMIELRYKKAWNPDVSIGKSLEDSTK